MRLAWGIFFSIVFFNFLYGQENEDLLLLQAENNIYIDPQEAIKIAEFLHLRNDSQKLKIDAAYILTKAYYVKGDYEKALKIGFPYSEEVYDKFPEAQLKLDVLITNILLKLKMVEQAQSFMKKALRTSEDVADKNIRKWFNAKILQYHLQDPNSQPAERVTQLLQAKTILNELPASGNPIQLGLVDIEIANQFLSEMNLDAALPYIQNANRESRKINPDNYLKMKTLFQFGRYYFLQRKHTAAIDSLLSAEVLAQKFENIPQQYTVSMALAENFLAIGDIKRFNEQKKKTESLETSLLKIEQGAVNVTYNYISKHEEQQTKHLQATLRNYVYAALGILILLILLWLFLESRQKQQLRQYEKINNYFAAKKEPMIKEPEKIVKPIKQTNVPKEMEKIILEKLSNFEQSEEFTNPDISLSRLALKFETNNKYLSEIVNSHKAKNFNAYINELRINYIINKLKNNPTYLQYKISFLAEDSGFSSHSVFATVFKQVIGLSPTQFISILKDKKSSAEA